MAQPRTSPPASFQRRDWTDAETERFVQMYPTSTAIDLVSAFGRSESALHQKACRLGLHKPRAAVPPSAPAKPAAEAPSVAEILGTTRTPHGMKTTYRNSAGGTVTRHTMK